MYLSRRLYRSHACMTLRFRGPCYQPLAFAAQSTPPSSHRIRTIRRQSSVGTYQDAPPQQQQQQQSQQPHSSVPISSSTSYYTNSPSPPHHGDAATMAQTLQHETAQHLQHSTIETHSDNLVVSRGQLEHINTKLDHLARRVQSLEQTLAADVKTILTLLQGQAGGGGEARHEMPEYENVNLDPIRSRHTFQRSVSEPKPISKSQQHSQVLHR
jgi:uncharacterized coiled-coil protein SlyX